MYRWPTAYETSDMCVLDGKDETAFPKGMTRYFSLNSTLYVFDLEHGF